MNARALYRVQLLMADKWNKFADVIAGLRASTPFQNIGAGILAAVGYYLGTKLGFALTPTSSPISTLWPPNAIVLALLLIVAVRHWWIPILVVLAVHLSMQLHAGIPIGTSIVWFVGNMSEALVGAVLIRRFVDPAKMFESVRGTVVFLCCGVVLAPLLTTFVDAAGVVVSGYGTHFWSIWTDRMFSNVLSELIFVPIVITFWTSAASWIKESNPARYLEAFALGVGILLVSFLAFSYEHPSLHHSPALIYVPLSLLIWAAVRFGLGGLSLSVLAVAIVSIEGAMHGNGPFTAGNSMRVNVISLQVLLCTVATPLMLLTAVTSERRRIQESLREVAQKLIGAQELERERIARELHDDIGQQLALISSGLSQLKSDAGDSSQKEIEALLKSVSDVAMSARDLSHGLHPSSIEYLGLERALRGLCVDISNLKSVSVRFSAEGLKSVIPIPIALCLYRVSQEALQNVLRHSGASEAAVRIFEQSGSIRLVITDNGLGFDPYKPTYSGLGLIGMRERLRILEGELRVSSNAGLGTTVRADVPLRRNLQD